MTALAKIFKESRSDTDFSKLKDSSMIRRIDFFFSHCLNQYEINIKTSYILIGKEGAHQ